MKKHWYTSFISLLGIFLFLVLSNTSIAQTYTMRDTTVTHCSGKLYDSGGAGSNYSNDEDSSFTITVGGASTITLTFQSFDLRSSGTDELRIYDGPSSASPLLAGPFSGNTVPGNVTSTGQSITIRFESDGSQNDPGFEIDWDASAPPNVTINANANPICSGDSVTFTVTDSSGAGDPDFSWQINGGPAASATNSFQYVATGLSDLDVVRVIMTPEAGGCYLKATDTSSIIMNVLPTATPSVSMSATDISICDGTNVVFTVTDSTDGGSDPAFQWMRNGINVGTDLFTYSNSVLTDNDTITVVMTSNLPSCLTKNRDTAFVIINVNPNPTVSIAGSNQVNCNGGNDGDATANGVGGSGTLSYSWNTAPVQNTAMASSLSAGTYLVTLTDDSLCFDTISVGIIEPSAINIGFTVTDASTFGAADGAIDATVSGGTVAVDYTYSWNTTPVQSTQDISNLVSRYYVLTVTDDNTCTLVDSDFVDQPALLTGGTIQYQGGATGKVCDAEPVGQFTQQGAISGGVGPYTYTWQFTSNLMSWSNFPSSDSSASFTYNSTISQDVFVRRRVTDANDSAFSNIVFLDYIADIPLAITGLSSNYCHNAANVTMSAIPSGGTFVQDSSYISGNTFIPLNTQGGGLSYPVVYQYTDGNSCYSIDTVMVLINDTSALDFELDANYPKTGGIDTLNGSPTGGLFSGIGVYQQGNGEFVFDPSIPTAGTSVNITYSYTAVNGCSSRLVKSTAIQNTSVAMVGFQLDKVYCRYDAPDTISIDLGASPPTVIRDSFFLKPLSAKGNDVAQAELGGLPGKFLFQPTLIPFSTVGDFPIVIRYRYYYPRTRFVIISTLPLQIGTVTDTLPADVYDTVNIVNTGNVRILANQNNSNGLIGPPFQYCENLTSVALRGAHAALGSNQVAHTFDISPLTAGLTHAGNNDTAFFNPSHAVNAASHTITYTYTDVESGCFSTVNESITLDTLPSVTLSGIDTIGGYCSNTGPVVLTGNPYATNQGDFLSGTISVSHINGNNFASFTTSPATVGNHTINYAYTHSATGCANSVQANFRIDTIPNLSIFLDVTSTCINNDSVRVQGRLGNSFNTGLGNISGSGVVDNSNSNSTHFDATIAGINTSPGHLITYSYTDNNNCSNTTDTTMIVHPLPNPSFTTSKAYVCERQDSVLFVPTFPLGIGESNSYFLNSSPIALNPAAYNPLHASSNGENSRDTILRVLTNGTTGCFDSATAVIIINPDVNPSITVDPQSFYCANQGDVGLKLNPPSEGNPGGTTSPQGGYFIENTLTVDLGGGNVTINPLTPGFDTTSFITNQVVGSQVILKYIYTDSITGCRATVRDTTPITSLPNLLVSDSTDTSPNNGFYCYGLTGTVYGGVKQNPRPIAIDSIVGFGLKVIAPTDSTFTFSTMQPTVPYSASLTFPVTYYYHDTSNLCANLTNFDVKISRPDSIDFSFVDAGLDSANHDTTICELDVDRVNLLLEPSSLPAGSSRRYKLNSETNLLGSNFFIPRQDVTVVGSNWVKYIITDKNGCEDSITHTIDIYANPRIGWVSPSLCAADSITFTDTSKISSGVISRREWDLSEGPASQLTTTGNQVKYKFLTTGSKAVQLNMISDWGCTADTLVSIEVDQPPTADFIWKRKDECGQTINLTNLTKNSSGSQNDINFVWEFGNTDTSHALNPQYTYSTTAQQYVLTLVAGFSDCADTINKLFTIRPNISSFPYFENFESGKNGWQEEYDYDNDQQTAGRWILGAPAKTKIAGAYSGNSSWVTGATGNYRSNDTTYVTSPCFDFSNLDRPMIRMRLNYAMEENDGVVLQYSTDTGTTVRWNKLGDSPQNGFNSGINWFTKDGIAGSPGKQKASERNAGWTRETNGKWIEARHNLDVLAHQPYVRFRFAIGSGEDTEDEGFAFDDIWIGERRKNVLLETFVNTSSVVSKSANDKMNPIIANNSKDVLSVQYHVSFPGPEPDPLNADNQADPSVRVLYYGLSESPYAIVDGNLYNGVPLVFNQEILQLQALRDPEFNISMNTTRTGNTLNITTELRADSSALNRLLPHSPSNVTLHVLVVEDSITVGQLPANSVTNGETLFLNTLKRMFPSAAGTNHDHTWNNGEVETLSLSAELVNYKGGDSDWKVIAFVQDNQTKAIYQAVYNNSSNPTTGIVFPTTASTAQGFRVYPNPTSGMAHFVFDEALSDDHNLLVVNQLGSVVRSEKIRKGMERHSIDTQYYTEGIYYLVLTDNSGHRRTEKLIIMR
jgi:hypothetical protein